MWIKPPSGNWVDTSKIVAVSVERSWDDNSFFVEANLGGGFAVLASNFLSCTQARAFADKFVSLYLMEVSHDS